MIGLFLDHIALKTDFSICHTFLELVRVVHAAMLHGRQHSEMPIVLLLKALSIPSTSVHTPLFQVLFNFMNAGIKRTDLPPRQQDEVRSNSESSTDTNSMLYGLSADRVPVAAQMTAKVDLLTNVTDGDEISFSMTYNSAIFTEQRMHQFARRYEALVRQVLDNPSEQIEQYSLTI
jgi:non-ribosomal peptide synthetase component F